MKLNCPECGAPIPAANINIQKMAAVCPDCGAVFQFDPPQAKAKRRKVHKPQNLELHETDEHVEMAFRTNFRLSQDESFIASASMSVGLTLMTFMIGGSYSGGEILSEGPIIALIPAAFAVLMLLSYYWLASVVYNKTHIEMDSEKITVSRKPLSFLFGQKK